MKILCVLLLLVFHVFQAPAFAGVKAEGHGVIKPMPRSQIVPAQSRVHNYASHRFLIQKGKKSERVEKKGKYWHFRYLIKDANGKIDRTVSREEIVQNYKEAALEKAAPFFTRQDICLHFL